MEEKLRDQFLQEADGIGCELMRRAKYDNYGVYWDTLRKVGPNNEWRSSEDLYAGNAGIILFLAELAYAVSHTNYHSFVRSALQSLYHRALETPTENYAFHTGRAGVAYLICLLAEFVEEEEFHQHAVKLMDGCEVFLDNPYTPAEFLNGAAGTLFVLTFLHSKTKDTRLQPAIKKYIEFIYKKAEPGSTGVYWDRSERMIKGLCGISHGASGMGLVFQELSGYFRFSDFKTIAEQAFAYEDECFNEETNNWPDFRKAYHNQESKQKFIDHYNSDDYEFFTSTTDMAAWCHGAPGIGFARLSKWQPSVEKKVLGEDISYAISRTIKSINNPNYNSFTLCHGLGGNALLLMEIAQRYNRPDLEAVVMKTGADAINQKNKEGYYQSGHGLREPAEDWSLFQGNAGIGYFFLQIASDKRISTILNPSIRGDYRGEADKFLSGLPSFIQVLLEKKFPKTLGYLKSINRYPDFSLIESDSSFSIVVSRFENQLLKNMGSDPKFEDVFQLEKAALSLDQKTRSFSLLHIARELEYANAEKLLKDHSSDDHEFINVSLASGLKFISTKYDWSESPDADPSGIKESQFQTLLIPAATGIEIVHLNPFSELLIDSVKKSRNLKEVIDNVISHFELNEDLDERQIAAYTIQELKSAAEMGIVRVSNESAVRNESSSFQNQEVVS